MPDGWTWKGAGAPWTLEAPHGVWAVSELRPGGRAELRYAPFDEEGRLPVAPLAIGEFASAACCCMGRPARDGRVSWRGG